MVCLPRIVGVNDGDDQEGDERVVDGLGRVVADQDSRLVGWSFTCGPEKTSGESAVIAAGRLAT